MLGNNIRCSPPTMGGVAQTVFGEEDQPGYTTGQLPTLKPHSKTALFIDKAGRQYQYFEGAWH